MAGRLKGKIALVTAAGQGIGRAIAQAFVAEGAKVIATDLDAKKLKGIKRVTARPLDVRSTEAVEALAKEVQKAVGVVDVLVNCAGLTDRGTVFDTTPELWDRMFAVNVRAPFFLMQAALMVMDRESIEGAMVNIISVNAHGGTSFLTPYSASKGALSTLTKNFAHSVSNRRIKVNGLNIGWVDTPGEHVTLKRFHNMPDTWLETAEKSRPWGRLMKPDEVARAVAYLASDESGLMTGSIIDFDQVVQGPNEQIGPAMRR